MTKNPFYNALFATAYIMVLITSVFLIPTTFMGQKESVFIPMAMLSLLVLSVALMAYLFFYQPVLMLIEGQRKEAVKLFLQTVGIFAAETAVLFFVSIAFSRLVL